MTTLLQVCKQVVKNAIDLSEYLEDSPLVSIVMSEYGSHHKSEKHYGMEGYLRGLPTVCTIPFNNFEILNLLEQEGIKVKGEKAQDNLIDEYWSACGYALYQLIK